MPITIPETWTGSEFVAKLNDNTLVYVSSPVEQIRQNSPSDSITNSDRLLVVLKNAIVANPPNSFPKYSLKLGSYTSATLSALMTQFGAPAAAPAPSPAPARTYPKLYLQDDIQITTETTNFGPSAVTINSLSLNNNPIINLADGSVPSSAVTVRQLTTAIDGVKATAASNLSTTTSSINAVSSKVDTILAGASTSLDTLKEIADYYSSLDTTQSLNLANQVTTLTGLVSTEQNRATTVEQAISTTLTAEVDRATAQEIANVRKTEYEIAVLPTLAVYADADQPQKIPDSLKASATFPGLDGWYYKNTATNA
jgi:hypothetical protein